MFKFRFARAKFCSFRPRCFTIYIWIARISLKSPLLGLWFTYIYIFVSVYYRDKSLIVLVKVRLVLFVDCLWLSNPH